MGHAGTIPHLYLALTCPGLKLQAHLFGEDVVDLLLLVHSLGKNRDRNRAIFDRVRVG